MPCPAARPRRKPRPERPARKHWKAASLLIPLCLVSFVLTGCLPRNQPADMTELLSLPQEPAAFESSEGEQRAGVQEQDQEDSAEFLRAMHFLPWRSSGPLFNATQAFGDVKGFKEDVFYGENLRPRPKGWVDRLLERCRPEAYPSLQAKAVTVRAANVRVLPTGKPAFKDPRQAGQGFPFDYLQYSSLWANTPVQVTHATRDRSWYFVETAHVYGWVRAEALAFLSDHLAERIRSLPLLAVSSDGFPVRDRQGRFLFRGRVGMLLPILSRQGKGYRCLALRADQSREAVPANVAIEPGQAGLYPLSPLRSVMAGTARELLGQSYGWGGLYGNRDCSATVRDFFIPFGIWLPRNSAQQAEMGRRIDLETETVRKKKQIILDRGVPFLTLITMPGHVMLYVGSLGDRAAVLHTLWGLRTRDLLGREGRLIVGSTVITDLYPGKDVAFLDRPGGELLHRITGMTSLARGVRGWDKAPFDRRLP